eukprot:m.36671 g.36671  ORF g.36671 m.36671 type:complete len:129 (-) comp5431_c0_seq1:696-1082(-)
MGGTGDYPNYQNYTAGNNYSETLRLEYDPSQTNYTDLLAAYWKFTPDPTMPCDDPAYCLRIFTVTSEQWLEAQASISAWAKSNGQTPIINVYNASEYTFWKAEEYHQHYFQKSGEVCGNTRALPMTRS